jgi:hypothetical protein
MSLYQIDKLLVFYSIAEDLLTLAYEPEAAAIYCKGVTLLKAEGNNRKIETFKNGQRFLVTFTTGKSITCTGACANEFIPNR